MYSIKVYFAISPERKAMNTDVARGALEKKEG